MQNKRKPKRYYNVRIDEETYKILTKRKRKTGGSIIGLIGACVRAIEPVA